MAKRTQTFTVRLADGTKLGAYAAFTENQAIATAIRDYAQVTASFRRSAQMVPTDGIKPRSAGLSGSWPP